MKLRPYQQEAVDATRAAIRNGARSVLIESPVGTGKTVLFSELARLAFERGRKTLVLAHRTELLEQAKQKLERVAGRDLRVELEQGSSRASSHAHVVVGSVQTLRGKRLEAWDPNAFDLIIIDEAHHATAASYRAILDHFARARVVGVTATPDRSDGAKLSKVFEAFPFQLGMRKAIDDGWLVPIKLHSVRVKQLSLANVKSRGGDFVESDLIHALESEDVLLNIARPLASLAGDRSTIVFVAGVENAHRLASLLVQVVGREGCAVALDGTTDDLKRRITLARFNRRATEGGQGPQFLVNVGLFTEGFDSPAVSCVAVARPTQSRALYCQMLGRGTRTLPGTVDGCADAQGRCEAIAASAKPDLLVLDFTPGARTHRLVTPVDVLGVEDPDVADRAVALLERNPELDVCEAIEQAKVDAQQALVARWHAAYRTTVEVWNPFRLIEGDLSFDGCLDIDVRAVRDKVEPPGIRDELIKRGVAKKAVEALTAGQCVAVLRAVKARDARGLCSLRIAAHLRRFGLNPNVSKRDGRYAMAVIRESGSWTQCPARLRDDPRFQLRGAA